MSNGRNIRPLHYSYRSYFLDVLIDNYITLQSQFFLFLAGCENYITVTVTVVIHQELENAMDGSLEMW